MARGKRQSLVLFPAAFLAAAALCVSTAAAAAPGEVKSGDRLAYALTGARVIAAPGRVFDPGVVIVRGGVVHGNIRARNAIEVHSPGKIVGNLHSPSLFIDRGVEFQGSCRMDVIDGKPPTKPATAPSPSAPRA